MQKTSFNMAIVFVLGVLAYSNTLNVPFLFDDKVFVESAMYKDVSNIPSFFTEFAGTWASRPLLHATLALNHYIGGMNTLGYHVVNLALHLSNGILLYLLVMMTGKRLGYDENDVRSTAFLSSLIFVLHPVQTEAVTYVISRSVLLSTTFYFSGLILFLKCVTSDKRKGLHLSGLFLISLMGISSRENFAMFPVVLLLYDIIFLSGLKLSGIRSHWKAYVPVLLALTYFLYIVLNHTYKKYGGYGKGIPPMDYILTQISVQWTYLRLLVLPINQNIDYDYPIARTLFDLPTLLSVAGYTCLLGLIALCAKRKPLVSFAVSWFILTLAPVSFLVALLKVSLGDVIFEHRLYLPSAALVVLVAASLIRFLKSHSLGRFVLPAAVILTIALGTATFARNSTWSDGISLWGDVIDKSPRKARGYHNIAMHYRTAGQTDTAIEFLEKALAITPDIAKSHYNLGNIYSAKKEFGKALEHYLMAVKIKPSFVSAHVNLGILYRKLGQPDKAIAHYEWAVSLKPDTPEPYFNLANAYMRQGRLDEAIKYYEETVVLSPGDPDAHNNLAIAYKRKGFKERASEHFRIAERLRRKGI